LGNRQTSLVPILGTFLLAGKLALGLCQFLLVLGKIVGIADVLTCRESDQTLDAQVKPDHLGTDRKRLDVLPNQDADEVAIGTVFGDRDRTGLTVLGKRAMEPDIQGSIHLGKREHLSVPREGIGGIGGRLVMTFFLEGGVLCTVLKEVD